MRNKDESIKRSFIVPNEIFCMDLSSYEIALYTYLLYCENRKTYICSPGLKTIADKLKCSTVTIRKYLSELEYKNLIEIKKTKSYMSNLNWKLEIKILPIQIAHKEYISTKMITKK